MVKHDSLLLVRSKVFFLANITKLKKNSKAENLIPKIKIVKKYAETARFNCKVIRGVNCIAVCQ